MEQLLSALKKVGGGGSLDKNSLAEAKKAAIRECEKKPGNAPCKVIAWVRNGCIAASIGKIKSGKTDGRLFTATGKPGQAEQLALERCTASGATECKIYAPEGCSVPEGMYD